MITKLNSHNY